MWPGKNFIGLLCGILTNFIRGAYNISVKWVFVAARGGSRGFFRKRRLVSAEVS